MTVSVLFPPNDDDRDSDIAKNRVFYGTVSTDRVRLNTSPTDNFRSKLCRSGNFRNLQDQMSHRI